MRFILLLSLLFSTHVISAQGFQFGFGADISHSEFRLPELTQLEFEELSVDVYNAAEIGFAFSLYSRAAISDQFSFSFSPSIQFNGALLTNYFSGLRIQSSIHKTALALPVALEWKSGQGKWQPIVSAGLGYLIKLKYRDYPSGFNIPNEFWFGQLSLGINCNSTTKFNIRPELVFWHSLSNLVGGELSDEFKVDWQYIGLRVLFISN